MISVISGFFINLPIGELCATFGVAGMGGSIQYVFEDDEKYKNKKINTGRLIGAIGAWSYFVAWFTVIPIFTIMVGYYLIDAFNLELEGWMETGFYLLLGVAVYSYTIGTSLKGLEGGAKFQMILTLFTIIPLVVIVCAPFFMGSFHLDTILDNFTTPDWAWDGNAFLLILSLLTIAQWSAVGWETAATYGAEYKEPAKDVPKALIMCGIACLVLYFLISFAVYGTLGPLGIEAAGATSLAVIAEDCFGETIGLVATLLLMVGMIVIVQTSMQGCSRTIQVMATNGHMPMWLSKTNKYGVPVNALIFQAAAGFLVCPDSLQARPSPSPVPDMSSPTDSVSWRSSSHARTPASRTWRGSTSAPEDSSESLWESLYWSSSSSFPRCSGTSTRSPESPIVSSQQSRS